MSEHHCSFSFGAAADAHHPISTPTGEGLYGLHTAVLLHWRHGAVYVQPERFRVRWANSVRPFGPLAHVDAEEERQTHIHGDRHGQVRVQRQPDLRSDGWLRYDRDFAGNPSGRPGVHAVQPTDYGSRLRPAVRTVARRNASAG